MQTGATLKVKQGSKQVRSNLLKKITSLCEREVTIGLHLAEARQKTVTGSYLCSAVRANEFGANIKVTKKIVLKAPSGQTFVFQPGKIIKIPERSFLRKACKGRNVNHIASKANQGLKELMDGPVNGGFRTWVKIGKTVQDIIQNEIAFGSHVPNSPITIAMKGSSDPLINTGKMFDAMKYKIKKRSNNITTQYDYNISKLPRLT